jgi:O-antigen/teichoic acid export membrane protein
MKRQFAKNLTSNWAVYGASAVISFFLMPYILGKVGQAALGIWILVGSFSGYLGLFDFGIGFAVVRFVARFQRTGEPERRNEVVATSFYLASILSVIVVIATIVIMHNAVSLFNIPPDLATSSRWVILLIGVTIAVGFPLSVFSEALSGGLWRFDLFNIVALFMAIARVGLTILFLELGWGLIGLGLAALIVSAGGYLWRAGLLFRLLPDLSIHPRLFSYRVIRMIGGYSFFSFILVLSGRIAFYSDSFIVGYFRGVVDVAVFGIAVKLTEYLRQLIFTMTRLFSPVAARYDPDADRASLKRLFYDGSRLNLLFSLPLSIILFFWGGAFIRLWVGEEFTYSQIILRILLVGHVLSFTQGIGGEILLGVGRHRAFAMLSLIGAIINIALSIILIGPLGLSGVAWGTTIPLALLSLGYVPAATLKLVGGRPAEFMRLVIGPAVLAVLAPAVLVILTAHLIDGYWRFAILIVLAVSLYIPGAYFLGLTATEKATLREIRHRIFGRFLA